MQARRGGEDSLRKKEPQPKKKVRYLDKNGEDSPSLRKLLVSTVRERENCKKDALSTGRPRKQEGAKARKKKKEKTGGKEEILWASLGGRSAQREIKDRFNPSRNRGQTQKRK